MKKFTSLLLCVIFIFTAISCADKSEKADNSSITITESSAEVETSVIETLAKDNFNGHNFMILGEVMRDYYTFEALDGEVIIDAVYNRNAKVEDMYNISLEFNLVEWKTAPKTITNLTASDDNTYDLYTSTHLYLGPIITSGSVQNWNNITSVDTNNPWYVTAANDTYSIGESKLLLFGDFLESNINNCWCMVVNKQKAQDYNLPDLYEAVDTGKWTIDYLMDQTKAIYEDLNGNSKSDEGDFYGFVTDIYAGIDSFSRTCELSAISKDSNNYPVLDFYNEKTVSAYEKLYTLYYECIGTWANKAAFSHIDTMFATGQTVISNTMIIMLMGDTMRDMKDDYGVLPYPKLTESQEMGYTHLDGTFSAMMVPISQPSENWNRTGIITEALNALGYEMVKPAMYDITLKTKISRDEDSIRMMDLILAGRRFSFDSLDEDGFPFSPVRAMRNLLSVKNKDIASYNAANEKSAINWVEKMIKAYEASK